MGAPPLLNYGRSARFPRIHWKPLLKPLLMILLACLLVASTVMSVLRPDIRTTVSLCTKCGLYQTTTEYCLPFTSIAFRRSDTQTQTPMSLVVQMHQLQLFHRHQFVIATIHGRHQQTGTAAVLKERVNPPFSTFIDTLGTYSDPITTEKWLERALNPDCYFPFAMAAAHGSLPTNQSEFQLWWERTLTGKYPNSDLGIVFTNDFKMERLKRNSSNGQAEE